MVIGFLGKGGSGKSTLSYRFLQASLRNGRSVLAIDADHNMDLAYNLGVTDGVRYFGDSLVDILRHVGIEEGSDYRQAFFSGSKPQFRLSPLDDFTAQYSSEINSGLRLMAAGPHTDTVLYDKSCSHALFTMLKVYLPYLQLNPGELVIVDEKAGSDGVGTGIASGFDFAVVASEPTPFGVKAANQIGDMLDFYGVPYVFVLNKVMEATEIEESNALLARPAQFTFWHDRNLARPHLAVSSATQAELDRMLMYLSSQRIIDTREQRSRQKFQKNREFASTS